MKQNSTAAKTPPAGARRHPSPVRPAARSGNRVFLAVGGCSIAGLAALLVASVTLHATARHDPALDAAAEPAQTIAYHPHATPHAKDARLRVAAAPVPIPVLASAPPKQHRLAQPVKIASKPVVAPFSMSDPSAFKHLPVFTPPVPTAAPQFAQVAPAAPVLMASLAPEHIPSATEAPASIQTAALAVPPTPELAPPMAEPRPQSAADALQQAIDKVPLPAARPDRPVKAAAPARSRALPSANVLAYARPDAGNEPDEDVIDARPAPGPSLGRGVAIYDITAQTVYLPNGERLEAHSGLGKMRDDPSQVHQKNRGPTPPHTYNLAMRESLFHGVEAIRLHPVGGQGKIHNRDGLLAHTYMLGKGGDSNGCVSFKDYKRFLSAFKRGEVKSLVVVASMPRTSRLAKPKSLLANLFKSKG